MTVPPVEAFYLEQEAPARQAPSRAKMSLRQALFGDAVSAILTLAIALLALRLIPKLLDWAILSGVWHGGPAACQASGGACWAFLISKGPQILLGIYPPHERWRPIAVIVIFLVLALWTLPPRNWRLATLCAWVLGILTALILMAGGIISLPSVPTSSWGGLPITLLLTVLSLALGFPLGVLLALGRHARLPVFRFSSIAFVEVVRGLPLLTLLFVGSMLVPLMLPPDVTVDNFFRALTVLTMYAAAYLAEVLRGGLQAIPRGQVEAARALALTRWQTLRLIVLPQAIMKVIPPLTNTIVVIVKNTGLVLVVGLFDLITAGRAALADPAWPFPYAETFTFVALIYFSICFSISRYALFLERRTAS